MAMMQIFFPNNQPIMRPITALRAFPFKLAPQKIKHGGNRFRQFLFLLTRSAGELHVPKQWFSVWHNKLLRYVESKIPILGILSTASSWFHGGMSGRCFPVKQGVCSESAA
jgi:hypothetical protein